VIRSSVVLVACALSFGGCTWAHRVMEPAPAPNGGFGPDEDYMKLQKNIPMDRV